MTDAKKYSEDCTVPCALLPFEMIHIETRGKKEFIAALECMIETGYDDIVRFFQIDMVRKNGVTPYKFYLNNDYSRVVKHKYWNNKKRRVIEEEQLVENECNLKHAKKVLSKAKRLPMYCFK